MRPAECNGLTCAFVWQAGAARWPVLCCAVLWQFPVLIAVFPDFARLGLSATLHTPRPKKRTNISTSTASLNNISLANASYI